MDRQYFLAATGTPMKKGDKVIVVQSNVGDASIIGKKGIVYNVHRLATGQIKVTVRMENDSLYHLDDTELEVISS
ncbi:MAG: hypothetical protein JRG73_06355 [Deltaproteobacteria bacterium]|nr:hypothetical protein [Deltaproteobacteria bacterium]MBW2306546.1 hypothetical protein [Deltaproteobacteria bacterium]